MKPQIQWSEIKNPRVECLLRSLERQIGLPLDPQPKEYEETLLHALRALGISHKHCQWSRELVQHVHFAMGPDRSPEVREEAFRLICSIAPSRHYTESNLEVCRDLSSALVDFWSSLTSESRDKNASDSCSTLEGIAKIVEFHSFIFRDQWIVMNYILAAESTEVNECAEDLLRRPKEYEGDPLPILWRCSRTED